MSVKSLEFMNEMSAAPFSGPGALEIDLYERQIVDVVRRTSIFLTRVRKPRANGPTHNYIEQTDIASAQFTDPRNIAPLPTGPARQPRSAVLKGLVAKSNITIFDKWATEQQGQFDNVISKDIIDVANAVTRLSAAAVWTGTDTNLAIPTTNQYMGLLRQITNTIVIGPGASVLDAVTDAVATIAANPQFATQPTAIYANPLLANQINKQASAIRMVVDRNDYTIGARVPAIATVMGDLPIISEPFIPATTDNSYGFPAPPSGYKNYFAVIMNEDLVEMPYLGPADNRTGLPTLFQLGLQDNLNGQFEAILFNCIIAKLAGYAHAVVCVQLPI